MKKYTIAVEDVGLGIFPLAGSDRTDGRCITGLSIAKALGDRGHHVELLLRPGQSVHPRWLSANVMVRHVSSEKFPRSSKDGRPFNMVLINHFSVVDRLDERTPIFYQPHEIETLRVERTGVENPKAVAMQEQLFKRARGILVPSRAIFNWLIEHGIVPFDRLLLVPHGIDTRVFYPRNRQSVRRTLGIDGDLKLLLYVGPVEIRKGLQTLKEAFDQLNHDNINLWFIGGLVSGANQEDLQLYQNLQAWAMDPRYAGRIRFLGRKAWFDLPDYYSAADTVVLPSLMEPYGLPTAEALACGSMIVGSNIDGFRELIRQEKDGILVPPGDSVELAGAIMRSLSEREWHSDARVAQRVAHAKTFTWDRAAITLESAIGQTSSNLLKKDTVLS